jgi:hypothetical protein
MPKSLNPSTTQGVDTTEGPVVTVGGCGVGWGPLVGGLGFFVGGWDGGLGFLTGGFLAGLGAFLGDFAAVFCALWASCFDRTAPTLGTGGKSAAAASISAISPSATIGGIGLEPYKTAGFFSSCMSAISGESADSG